MKLETMKILKTSYLFLSIFLLFSACNKEEDEVPQVVENEAKPTAAFEFSLVDDNDPFTFQFDNQSTDHQESRWTFADDSTSSEVSPIHTFLQTGTYLVKLIVLNGEGFWAQREETINISPSNLIEDHTERSGGGLRLSYDSDMQIEKTEWLDGYDDGAPSLS